MSFLESLILAELALISWLTYLQHMTASKITALIEHSAALRASLDTAKSALTAANDKAAALQTENDQLKAQAAELNDPGLEAAVDAENATPTA